MKYKLCLPILAMPILLVACNQKKAETQTMDADTGKVNDVAKEMPATAGEVESVAKPGDEFIKTAKQYQEKSTSAREAGDSEKASIYSKLAEIKMEAATAADEGKGYDWTHYHELVKQLDK